MLRAQGRRPLDRKPRGRAAPDQAAGPPVSTRTTIVLSTLFEKPGIASGGGRLMAGLRGRALIAYLLVCTVWGSTYLAIRIGVMHLPPMLFAGIRFVIAGALARRHRARHRRPAAAFAARLEGARDHRPLPAARRQCGGGLGRAARGVGSGQRVRGGGAARGPRSSTPCGPAAPRSSPGGSASASRLGFLGSALLAGVTPGELLSADLRPRSPSPWRARPGPSAPCTPSGTPPAPRPTSRPRCRCWRAAR